MSHTPLQTPPPGWSYTPPPAPLPPLYPPPPPPYPPTSVDITHNGWLAVYTVRCGLLGLLISLPSFTSIGGVRQMANDAEALGYVLAAVMLSFVLPGLEGWKMYSIVQRRASTLPLVAVTEFIRILPCGAIAAFGLLSHEEGGFYAAVLFGLVATESAVWIAYFSTSERVRRTFGKHLFQ